MSNVFHQAACRFERIAKLLRAVGNLDMDLEVLPEETVAEAIAVPSKPDAPAAPKIKRGRPPRIAQQTESQPKHSTAPKHMTGLKAQVVRYLEKHADGNSVEIGQSLNTNPSYISQILGKLLGEGRLINHARGRYKLDPDFEEAA